MDLVEILQRCFNTLDKVSVSGFDNQDRMVGVMKTLSDMRPQVAEMYRKLDDLQKQIIELTKTEEKEELDG